MEPWKGFIESDMMEFAFQKDLSGCLCTERAERAGNKNIKKILGSTCLTNRSWRGTMKEGHRAPDP